MAEQPNDLTDNPPGSQEPVGPEAKTIEERLDSIEKNLADIPKYVGLAFDEYDKKLRASLTQGNQGGSNLIGEVLGLVKQGLAPQSQGTDEIQGLTKELVTLNLKGMLQDWRKRMGLVEHVAITHK